MKSTFAKLGAVAYAVWGIFHVYVAWQIYDLGRGEQGLAQGRLFQLAAWYAHNFAFCCIRCRNPQLAK
jgi:hypothetical protein